MKKEIIVTKTDWRATLNKFQVGEIHQFQANTKEVINIRQTASRQKGQEGKKFTTSILDDGIEVRREA